MVLPGKRHNHMVPNFNTNSSCYPPTKYSIVSAVCSTDQHNNSPDSIHVAIFMITSIFQSQSKINRTKSQHIWYGRSSNILWGRFHSQCQCMNFDREQISLIWKTDPYKTWTSWPTASLRAVFESWGDSHAAKLWVIKCPPRLPQSFLFMTAPLSQVRNEFYKDTQGVILVYDAGNKRSFDNLEKWLDEMKNELSHPRDLDNVVFCVCANKVWCWTFSINYSCQSLE